MEHGKLSRSQRRRQARATNKQNERNSNSSHNLHAQSRVTPLSAPPLGPGPLIGNPNGLNKMHNSQGPISNPTGPNPSAYGTMGQNSMAPNTSSNGPKPKPSGAQSAQTREQDLYMPIANVVRIMRRALPPHAKVADEAKEMVQECVSEFISFVTGEANDACQTERRKTITAEDVIGAMSRLGFDHYVEPLTVYLHKYRESEMLPPAPRRGGYGPGAGGARIGPTNDGLPPFAVPLVGPPQFGMFGSPSGSGGSYHDGSIPMNVNPTSTAIATVRDGDSPSPSLGLGLGNGPEERAVAAPSRSGVGFQPYVPKK